MSAQRSGAFRTERAWWLVAAALVVALVAGAVWWSSHDRRGPAVGQRVDGATVFVDQLTEHRAQVPGAFGPLWLTIGTGHEIGRRDDPVRAPDGASLVEVAWGPGYSYGVPPVWPGTDARDRRDPGTDLTLVTGGRRYPLAQDVLMADGAASVVLVVEGDASDARVESRVDGRLAPGWCGRTRPTRCDCATGSRPNSCRRTATGEAPRGRTRWTCRRRPPIRGCD